MTDHSQCHMRPNTAPPKSESAMHLDRLESAIAYAAREAVNGERVLLVRRCAKCGTRMVYTEPSYWWAAGPRACQYDAGIDYTMSGSYMCGIARALP